MGIADANQGYLFGSFILLDEDGQKSFDETSSLIRTRVQTVGYSNQRAFTRKINALYSSNWPITDFFANDFNN